jgi:hypothetical protein
MIEITRQMTGMAKKVNTIADTLDLINWAHDNPGYSCTVVAQVDGNYHIEMGGLSVDSVVIQLGQWVVFDGSHFQVMSQEDFDAKGYSAHA